LLAIAEKVEKSRRGYLYKFAKKHQRSVIAYDEGKIIVSTIVVKNFIHNVYVGK